jgi:hypothetical protein
MCPRVPCQSLQHADLDETSGASRCVGGLCSRPSRRTGLIGLKNARTVKTVDPDERILAAA